MGKSKAAKPKAAPKAAPAPAAPLKAHGTTTKRTPTSAFDGAAGNDVYEPEKVLASRLAREVTQYLVKWVGYESKDNTWEERRVARGVTCGAQEGRGSRAYGAALGVQSRVHAL